MEHLFQILLDFTSNFGYWGVFLLMVVESSFVPFPSELVIPPAAYLAYQGEMQLILVVIFGILGSLVGAILNYFLAMWLGRPLVYALTEKKWAKIFLISSKKVEKAESYFLKYGGVSTFLGRLLPAVRQLISLPAGFSRYNFGRFVFFTTIGAGFWVIVLAVLGYYFGANQEIIMAYSSEIGLYSMVFVILVVVFLYFTGRFRKKI